MIKNPLSHFRMQKKNKDHSFKLGIDMETWGGRGDWNATCHLKEEEKKLIFRFELPGVKKEDILIELEGNRLTVSGHRFFRAFNLPMEVQVEKITAVYIEGILEIRLPKVVKAPKAKRIEIE